MFVLPNVEIEKLRQHGHPDFWELAIADDGTVFVDCTKCGDTLVGLTGDVDAQVEDSTR